MLNVGIKLFAPKLLSDKIDGNNFIVISLSVDQKIRADL